MIYVSRRVDCLSAAGSSGEQLPAAAGAGNKLQRDNYNEIPLALFLKMYKLTMTIVEETTFPFMVCLRGSGMAEVWFLFLSAAYSKTNAGALPQTPGFNALVSRERLAALPHLLYHTSF